MRMALLAAVVLIAGCATKAPPLTRDEQLAQIKEEDDLATRVYEGVTADQVLRAADKLFMLADPDFKVEHTATAIHAYRKWILFLVIAADTGVMHFQVDAVPISDGRIKTTLKSASTSSMLTGYASSGGSFVTGGWSPSEQRNYRGTALYHAFFRRLDYLLNKSPQWPTCKDIDEAKEKEKWRGFSVICTPFIADLAPDDPRAPK